MRRLFTILLFSLLLSGTVIASDIIVTKKGARVEGKIVDRRQNKYVLKRADGSLTIFDAADISMIIRDNHILDFEKKVHFLIEKRRPYLPFLVLTAATGYYSVKKFQDYAKHRDEADAESPGTDYQNLKDESKKDLAYGIVSGLFCIGSFYVALKPVEVKTVIGTFQLSATPSTINLAVHF